MVSGWKHDTSHIGSWNFHLGETHVTSAHISLDKASPWPCLISKKVEKYNLTVCLKKEVWIIRKYPNASHTGIPASLDWWFIVICLKVSNKERLRHLTSEEAKLLFASPQVISIKVLAGFHAYFAIPRMGTGFASLLKSTMKVKVKVKSLSRARLFATPWIVACTKLVCPWDFQGKSTGVCCDFLFQGTFPTQGSNPGLSHCRQTLYHLSHQGSPKAIEFYVSRKILSQIFQRCLGKCQSLRTHKFSLLSLHFILSGLQVNKHKG